MLAPFFPPRGSRGGGGGSDGGSDGDRPMSPPRPPPSMSSVFSIPPVNLPSSSFQPPPPPSQGGADAETFDIFGGETPLNQAQQAMLDHITQLQQDSQQFQMTQQDRIIQAFQDSQAQSLERMHNLRMEEMRADMMREIERTRQEAERERKMMQEKEERIRQLELVQAHTAEQNEKTQIWINTINS